MSNSVKIQLSDGQCPFHKSNDILDVKFPILAVQQELQLNNKIKNDRIRHFFMIDVQIRILGT